uniref:Probable G-protein coupled receptor 88 n=1 Tax=Geotrypetes seraphini TaxID=260995 RepID=A0A6P8PB19_GEOSA|nr:probable G-protein coupled receptor 88 [Geotrypetes seraphini]
MTNSSQRLHCEDSSGARVLVPVLYSFFSLSGTLANLAVIGLVCSSKRLKTTSNAFIVNGCVADLSLCAFWMPREAVALARAAPKSSAHQALAEGLALLWTTVSLLSHALVALNRYVLITKAPPVYQTIYQRRNAECMIAVSWAVPLLFLLPRLLGQRREDGAPTCAGAPGKGVQAPGAYTAILWAATVLVLLYCYFKIFRKVQSSVKRVSVLGFQAVAQPPCSLPRKEKRLGLHVLCVCCAFVVATAPLVGVIVFALVTPVAEGLRTAAWLLFCSLFVLDPFLYTCTSEEFRRAFRSAVRGECGRSSSVSHQEPWPKPSGRGDAA